MGNTFVNSTGYEIQVTEYVMYATEAETKRQLYKYIREYPLANNGSVGIAVGIVVTAYIPNRREKAIISLYENVATNWCSYMATSTPTTLYFVEDKFAGTEQCIVPIGPVNVGTNTIRVEVSGLSACSSQVQHGSICIT